MPHLFTAWLAWALPAFAGCESPTTTADVQLALEAIDAAYSRADSARFTVAQAELGDSLTCLTEEAPRFLIAAVHRARGLRAWVEQDPDAAMAAFAAARAIEPEYRFPEAMLPERHPIRVAYASSEPMPGAADVPPPADGTLAFDGRRGAGRPTAAATLMQRIDTNGAVKSTHYLLPSDRLPVYDTAKAPAQPARRTRAGWWLTSAAGVGLAGATYAVAATRRAAYDDAAIPEKPALRQQTNTLVAVSAGLGAAAIGAGAIALARPAQATPAVWPR